jgi:hypothetical protein
MARPPPRSASLAECATCNYTSLTQSAKIA